MSKCRFRTNGLNTFWKSPSQLPDSSFPLRLGSQLHRPTNQLQWFFTKCHDLSQTKSLTKQSYKLGSSRIENTALRLNATLSQRYSFLAV